MKSDVDIVPLISEECEAPPPRRLRPVPVAGGQSAGRWKPRPRSHAIGRWGPCDGPQNGRYYQLDAQCYPVSGRIRTVHPHSAIYRI